MDEIAHTVYIYALDDGADSLHLADHHTHTRARKPTVGRYVYMAIINPQ
jgi:hypothetical protein